MRKKKKEVEGPRGMTKRTTMGKHTPPPLPPDIGDVVWYPGKKGQWRTGRLIQVIDRGEYWGKCEVKDSETGRLVKVLPELVRAPEKTPKKSLGRGV